VGTNTLQQIVIVLLVFFDVGREVQQRLVQTFAFDQEQRNQQSANAAISIQERIDGFELLMHDRALHQIGHGIADVNEFFPVVQAFIHCIHRWRHIGRWRRRTALRTDPVL